MIRRQEHRDKRNETKRMVELALKNDNEKKNIHKLKRIREREKKMLVVVESGGKQEKKVERKKRKP